MPNKCHFLKDFECDNAAIQNSTQQIIKRSGKTVSRPNLLPKKQTAALGERLQLRFLYFILCTDHKVAENKAGEQDDKRVPDHLEA